MHRNIKLYGVGKIGPKGQVVIPAEARKELDLQPDDIVVLAGSPRHKIVAIVERSSFERHLGFMQRRNGMVADILDELKKIDEQNV